MLKYRFNFEFAKITRTWEDKIKVIAEYYSIYHKYDVPKNLIFNGVNINSMINNIRNMYKNNILTNHQIEELEKYNFVFIRHADSWNNYIDALKSFYESENNQLHRDKAILRVMVEDLECENEKLQREIDSLMGFANLKPEERKRILERSEMLNGINQLFTGISKIMQ